MEIIHKFMEIKFVHEKPKEAFLECTKWIAENITKKKVEVVHKIIKESADLPTFRLEIYAVINEHDSRKSFCNACQEFHKNFYLNQQFNCDACNMTAYLKVIKGKLKIIKEYQKKKIRE